MDEIIYTHDEAMLIVELFEDVLDRYGISVPSDEDDERDIEESAGLYGSTYSDLLDSVEDRIIDILSRHKADSTVVNDVFSGRA